MSRVDRALIDEVLKRACAKLIDAGMRKRSGEIFTRALVDEVIGWVGLNRATGREDGIMEINPVIGVRHQTIERVLAEIREQKFHPYIPPTISRPLGYLMPQNTYVPWYFETNADNAATVDEMVAAICQYGEAFMRENVTLDTIVEKVALVGFGLPHQLAYRRPTAFLVMGQPAKTLAALDAEVAALGARTDPAAADYRHFAARAKAWITGHQAG